MAHPGTSRKMSALASTGWVVEPVLLARVPGSSGLRLGKMRGRRRMREEGERREGREGGREGRRGGGGGRR